MNWDIVLSVVLSAGLFLILAVLAFLASVFASMALWDTFKSPETRATETYSEEDQEKIKNLRYGSRFFHNSNLSLAEISDSLDEELFVLRERAVDSRFIGPQQPRETLEEKFPDFANKVERFEKEAIPGRIFRTSINILMVPSFLVLASTTYMFAIEYFGIEFGFANKARLEMQAAELERFQSDLVTEIQSDISLLIEPDELLMGDANRITQALPGKLARLQVELSEQTKQTEAARLEIQVANSEIIERQKELNSLRTLTDNQLGAVRTSITEEAEESSRRYYLLGLLISIPLFWLSSILQNIAKKGWSNFLNWYFRRRKKSRLSNNGEIIINDQNN